VLNIIIKMDNKGRKYINFDRQLETEANCLTFKPVPMLITNEMLNVPQGNHSLDGVKPARDKRLPARPKNLLALANSLANVGQLPVQVVLDKLEKEERQLVRNHLNNTWGFMGDADSSVSGSIRSPSEYSSEEHRLQGYQFLGTESDASSEYQMGEDEILAGRRNWGGRRMGAGRPSNAVRQIAYSEGIPVREARMVREAGFVLRGNQELVDTVAERFREEGLQVKTKAKSEGHKEL
jgi:hypothetical protein